MRLIAESLFALGILMLMIYMTVHHKFNLVPTSAGVIITAARSNQWLTPH
jgi:hypothetical protein